MGKAKVTGVAMEFLVAGVAYAVGVTSTDIPFGLGDRIVNLLTQNHAFLFDGTQTDTATAPHPAYTGAEHGDLKSGEAFGNDFLDVEPEEAQAEGEAEEVDYASFTKLKDLVVYLHTAGYPHYADIFIACTELIAGDLCPMLNKVSNLESRLKTTCQAAGIPV